MPHNYPTPHGGRPNAYPISPPSPLHIHSPSPSPSRYLTPIQEERILSWRSNTSATSSDKSNQPPPPPPPPPSTSTTKSYNEGQGQSAPAVLILHPDGSLTSRSSPCPGCAGKSVCSCPTTTATLSASQTKSSSRSRPKAKSYYSSKKKSKSTDAGPGATPRTLLTPNENSGDKVDKADENKEKKGFPNHDQLQAYHMGSPPLVQFGNAPKIPFPNRPLAMPPTQPPLPLPRIAGARDPVSQNYWRQMFPPTALPGMPLVPPGPTLHPPPAWGLAGRPWGV